MELGSFRFIPLASPDVARDLGCAEDAPVGVL